MKSHIFLPFLLLTFFSSTVYPKNRHNVSTQHIKNEFFNLSISIPDDWNLQTNSSLIIIQSALIPESIQIKYLKETKASLTDNFEFHINKLLAETKDITIINQGVEHINKQPFCWIEFEMNSLLHNNICFRQRLYMTMHNHSLYSIVITSTKDRFEEYFKCPLSILRTLKME